MKTTTNKLATLAALAIMLFTNAAFALKTKHDSTQLRINGLILKSENVEEGKYTVELFYHNTIIESNEIEGNKPFVFKLYKNTWYTLRISREGFVPLLISVDTEMLEENSNKYQFSFQTGLIKEGSIQNINKEVLDFPIGIVKYNKESDNFSPVEDYTTNMRKQIFNEEKFVQNQKNELTLASNK